MPESVNLASVAANRAEGRAVGTTFYHGKGCPHGHSGIRYVSNGMCRSCGREWDRAAYAADPSKKLAYHAKRHVENPAPRRAYTAKWRAENPEAARVQWNNRHARKRAAEGHHTADDIRTLFQTQRGKCVNCRKALRKNYHVDHVIPLARGGTNWPNNLQLLCPKCNQTKAAKCPIAWAQQNGRLV